MVGGSIVVTADGQDVDTSMAGFTVSPHEECGVEEAIRIVERVGGSVTVATLGPASAADQLREMLALGANRAILLETDGSEWGPVGTAAALVEELGGRGFDLLIFGNEAADTGGYQVPVRAAHWLGLPCVTGIKRLEVLAESGRIRAGREYAGVEETFDVPLPAVVSVKEGINLPRYPSLPGRLRAKRASIETIPAGAAPAEGLTKRRLTVPLAGGSTAEVLGSGVKAVPALVRVLDELGVLR